MGSKFYIGHLLDAAKLTKRDLALIKATAGDFGGGRARHFGFAGVGIINLMACLTSPSAKGKPLWTITKNFGPVDQLLLRCLFPSSTAPSSGGPRRRKFNRRRFREALVAIMEDEEPTWQMRVSMRMRTTAVQILELLDESSRPT